MKVLIINTYDDNAGAAIASYRLYKGLQQTGVNSQMFVQNKTRFDPGIISSSSRMDKFRSFVRPFFEAYPLTFYKNRQVSSWSPAWVPHSISKIRTQVNPDIIHLHWICEGFLPVSEITKIKQPIVWTMHDMWPFTGGCHYSDQCLKYQQYCGACPQLGSHSKHDLSSWVWGRKKKHWKNLDLTIVSPSNWLAGCARNSSLFGDRKIVTIPNGLDLNRFKPVEKEIARNLLNLPQEKKLILFGAVSATTHKRKGFQYLLEALNHLKGTNNDERIEAVVFGSEKPHHEINTGFRINYLGNLPGDIAISLLYSAADVFVAPSLQENLALTIQESIACGTPVVAFDIGGNSDMIDHKKNGYLAKPFDSHDVAEGIAWVLSDEKQWKSLSVNCRSKAVANFEILSVAQQYARLYQEILK
jgi:glycosyltransferase involved in cell wall biosynthesis